MFCQDEKYFDKKRKKKENREKVNTYMDPSADLLQVVYN